MQGCEKNEIWELPGARWSWLNKHDNSLVVMWETTLDVISRMTKLEEKTLKLTASAAEVHESSEYFTSIITMLITKQSLQTTNIIHYDFFCQLKWGKKGGGQGGERGFTIRKRNPKGKLAAINTVLITQMFSCRYFIGFSFKIYRLQLEITDLLKHRFPFVFFLSCTFK